MRTFLVGLIYAVATGFYWWAVTVVSYGLFGGSTRPGGPPSSETYAQTTTIVTIVASVVVYALLFVILRSVVNRSRPRR